MLLASAKGFAVRFAEDRVRPMGRNAAGVRGITLREGDRDVPVPRDGNDVERMLAHFRDVVLGKAKPLVSAAEALDVMRATRAAIAALDEAGAPFDRANAPRHVASPALAAFPRSPNSGRASVP